MIPLWRKAFHEVFGTFGFKLAIPITEEQKKYLLLKWIFIFIRYVITTGVLSTVMFIWLYIILFMIHRFIGSTKPLSINYVVTAAIMIGGFISIFINIVLGLIISNNNKKMRNLS